MFVKLQLPTGETMQSTYRLLQTLKRRDLPDLEAQAKPYIKPKHEACRFYEALRWLINPVDLYASVSNRFIL